MVDHKFLCYWNYHWDQPRSTKKCPWVPIKQSIYIVMNNAGGSEQTVDQQKRFVMCLKYYDYMLIRMLTRSKCLRDIWMRVQSVVKISGSKVGAFSNFCCFSADCQQWEWWCQHGRYYFSPEDVSEGQLRYPYWLSSREWETLSPFYISSTNLLRFFLYTQSFITIQHT